MKKSVKRHFLWSVLIKILRAKLLLTLGLLLSLAGALAFALIPPLVLERIVNALADGSEIPVSLALGYFAVLALSELFVAAREIAISLIGQKITRGIRREMCGKLSRLPASFFVKSEPGVTVSRFVGDVDTVEVLFASGIIGMFADICKVIGILAVIFVKSTGLGILMLLVAPLLFLFTRSIQKRMLSAQIHSRTALGKLNHFVEETIHNIRMIHVFRKEKYMEEKYGESIEDGYRAIERINRCDAVYSPVILIVSALIVAVMMLLAAMGGTVRTFFGMSVGTAVAIIAYVGKVFEPLENIGMEIQNVQSAVAGVKRIDAFMEEEERGKSVPLPRGGLRRDAGIPAVSLSGVDFGYDNRDVLEALSFAVEAGESVTLVGSTGAGKSTVFKLILGMYAPRRGEVRVFGTDASTIPDGEKRRIFGYVEQSFRAVPGTVYDQIAVFDPLLTKRDVEKAAELAGIHERILSFPDGYETRYNEGLFSEGQRQLLAVARAVAADPAILLLDEITANLDAATEESVLTALRKASGSRTVLSISHRLYEQLGGRRVEIPDRVRTEN